MGVTGLETAFAALHTDLVLPGTIELGLLVERMAGGAAPVRDRATRAWRRARGQRRPLRPRRRVDGGRGRLREPLAELLVRRPDPDRPGAGDRRRRPGRLPPAQLLARGRGVSGAYLLLEDGDPLRRRSPAAHASAVTGEVVFNTAMTGYQESVTDPSYAGQIIVFTYPLIGNYGVSAAAMESDRVHARGVVMRDAKNREDAATAEGGWLDWLGDCGVPAISGVDTRALVRHIRDRGAMRGGIFPAETPEAEARERVAAEPSMDGADLARTVTPPEPVRFDGDGPHVVGIDTGIKMSIVRQLRERGCQADPAALHQLRRAGPRRGSRPRLPRQRPRRPGGARLRRRHRPRAGRQAARLRHLPRPPAALPRRRPRDLQAALRPPRRQPPGQGPGDGADRHHLAEPRLRGRRPRRGAADRGRRAGPLGDRLRRRRALPAQPLRPHGRGPGPARRRRRHRPVPPRGGPRPARRPPPLRQLPGAGRLPDAAPRRHPEDPPDRLRPDRDRPGGRVRLLRRPGLQGAARGGLRGRPRQLEPGDDHDRPRVRHRHLHRAAAARPGDQDHRKGAPRRAAADARRPDGAEPGDGAARGRHPGALRGRADRRRRRRDPPRRGPRGVPHDDDRGRACGSPGR